MVPPLQARSIASRQAILDAALADYVARRDRETTPMFDFTVRLAQLAPPTPAENALFAAIAAADAPRPQPATPHLDTNADTSLRRAHSRQRAANQIVTVPGLR